MKKGLLMFCTIALTAFGLKNYSASFCSHFHFFSQTPHYLQPELLANDYFASIKSSVHNSLKNGSSADAIIAQLKKKYPLLNKITIAYRPTGIYIKMLPHEPMCCVNDDSVFTKNHALFPKDFFNEDALARIAQITVAPEYVPKIATFIPFLDTLSTDFFQHYTIELNNEHYVRLTDTQNERFAILTGVEQKKLPQLLEQCSLIKENIIERKGFDKGAAWITDIRFSDYIIAYKA
jgi:hypothetical protein